MSSVLEDSDKALKEFVDTHVSCASCEFWERELFGGNCTEPELSIGFLENDDSMCEQHNFRDKRSEDELRNLQDKWYNAWHFVIGFLYD
jgi:hypothetical protein